MTLIEIRCCSRSLRLAVSDSGGGGCRTRERRLLLCQGQTDLQLSSYALRVQLQLPAALPDTFPHAADADAHFGRVRRIFDCGGKT
jgi:hypothetical protein